MKQQVALVTGSNRGIGFEIAKQLAMKKIEVILTSRNSANGEVAVRKLARDGVKKVVAMELDVSNQVSVDNLLDKVERTFGRLDILVNNAAILIDGDDVTASNVDLDTVKTTLETNLIGAWRMCRAFIPLMKKKGYGRIVNVSSGAGEFEYMATSGGYWPAYSLSKASLNALTVMLASELKGTIFLSMRYVRDGCELIWEGQMLQDQLKKVLTHLFGWPLCLMVGRQGTIFLTRSKSIGKISPYALSEPQ